jgi:hypothetical protein
MAVPAVSSASETCTASFERATETLPLLERRYVVAGRPLRLLFAGAEMELRLARAFAHLDPFDEATLPELTVRLWDSGLSAAPKPPLPETRVGAAQGGVYYGLDDGVQYAYQPGPLGLARHGQARPGRLLSVLDADAQEAWFWTEDARTVPYWDSAGPIRQILHWWLGSGGLQQLHGGAVGVPDLGGVLIVGRGGSGKSTTTLSTILSGLLYAGDDYVAVEIDGPPRVHSLYSSGKLEPDHLERLPHLRAIAQQPGDDGDKVVLYVHETHPDATCTGFPLRAVVVPRITERAAPQLVPASPAAALRALAPSTLLQLYPPQPDALARMRALVGEVPAYTLELGSDIAAIPRVLLELLQSEGFE